MERSFYDQNVRFIDPMTEFTGVDAYQNNVDTLAGRTGLGKLLFEDASIVLHNIYQLEPNKLQTRWTLQVTAKLLPWKPRAKFSGISIYAVDDRGKVLQQEDYWDSVNLYRGNYVTVSKLDGISSSILSHLVHLYFTCMFMCM